MLTVTLVSSGEWEIIGGRLGSAGQSWAVLGSARFHSLSCSLDNKHCNKHFGVKVSLFQKLESLNQLVGLRDKITTELLKKPKPIKIISRPAVVTLIVMCVEFQS